MQSVHAKLLAYNAVKMAYSCVVHALNNCGENVAKVKYDTVLKQGLFVSKTVRSQNLLRQSFDSICEETIGKQYNMVLYSKIRWSSSNRMFCQHNQTKQSLVYLPTSLIYKRERLKRDMDWEIPRELSKVLGKPHF